MGRREKVKYRMHFTIEGFFLSDTKNNPVTLFSWTAYK